MKQLDLQKLRREAKISQKQLAEALQVAQSFVSAVENGKNPMPDYWTQKIIDVFKISDISLYEVEVPDPLPGILNHQEGANTFNDLDKVIALLQSRDDLFREVVREKDSQISRLIGVIENMHK